MKIYSIFHHLTKDHAFGKRQPIPKNPDDWPPEWRTTYYKAYEKVEKIPLPSIPLPGSLTDTLKNRVSASTFSKKPLSLAQVAAILEHACGETAVHDLERGRKRRPYPSGGARYPLELYIFIFRSAPDLASGIYHYNVREHCLEVLTKRTFSEKEIGQFFTYPWVTQTSAVVVCTAVFSRTLAKYADRGYRYILLEAGHLSQNIYLVCTALGIQCRGLGGSYDEAVERALAIDGTTESLVHTNAIGL